MSSPSSNFVSYHTQWDSGPAGWSIYGNCHDVLTDVEFCHYYYDSIGLSFFSPPYGSDAVSNSGHIVTPTGLAVEMTSLLNNLVRSRTWKENSYVVIEIGDNGDSLSDMIVGIANSVDNIWCLGLLEYSRFGRTGHQPSHLIIFCISEYGPTEDVYARVDDLNSTLSCDQSYAVQVNAFGQDRYRKKVPQAIRNTHQLSGHLVRDIIYYLGWATVADWYSGSNLTGAVASGSGLSWVSTENNALQFLNQTARFDNLDYDMLLKQVGHSYMPQQVWDSPQSYRLWVQREFSTFLALHSINANGSQKAIAQQSWEHQPTVTTQPKTHKPKPQKKKDTKKKQPKYPTRKRGQTSGEGLTPRGKQMLETIASEGRSRYCQALEKHTQYLLTQELIAYSFYNQLCYRLESSGYVVGEKILEEQGHGRTPVGWMLTDKAYEVLSRQVAVSS